MISIAEDSIATPFKSTMLSVVKADCLGRSIREEDALTFVFQILIHPTDLLQNHLDIDQNKKRGQHNIFETYIANLS